MIASCLKIYSLFTDANRKATAVLFGFIVIGTIVEVLGVGLILPVIVLLTDDNSANKYPVLRSALQVIGNPSHETQVQIIMIILVGTYCIKNLYLAFLVWWQARFSFNLQVELSQRLFTVYLNQPYTFHLQRNSAQLFRNVTSEVNEIVGRGVNPILIISAEILIMTSIIILLVSVEPLGALVSFVVLFTAAWIFQRSTRARITQWGEKRLYHDGLRVKHLNQGLGGVKDIKLFGREDEFLVQFLEHSRKSAHMTKLLQIIQQLPRLWLEFLAVTGLALLVLIMISQGHDISSILPIMGLFAVAAFRLMPSVNRIILNVQSLRYSMPAINHLYDDFQLPMPIIENNEIPRGKVAAISKDICLANITYKYPDTLTATLAAVTIKINHGELVGIIGTSGAGKSTLVDVILGLLTPQSGEVLVDGININQNIRNWQNQIGYVPQFIYLTDDSLRRNIAFGLPNEQINDEAVNKAIKDAQLDSFVLDLPSGMETLVGERGVRLSGGQRQRIGIARALYHDPDVLVLDEATSALDIATEVEVMRAINALHGKKTIIIVAHRLSTIENCDIVYRLDLGRVVNKGTPEIIIPSN